MLVLVVDAWLCILSSPPHVGHLGFMVYVLSGGVLNRRQAGRVLLLAWSLHPYSYPCSVASAAGQTMNASICCLSHVALDCLSAGPCCGRMAVYSQQPTTCRAPWFHCVCPQWWRPKQTASRSSSAPCLVAASIFLPLFRGISGRANHECINLLFESCCLGLSERRSLLWTHGCVFSAAHHM